MDRDPKKRRRPILRFSIRLMIAVTTLLCVFLGLHMHGVRQQRDVVAKLAGLGVVIRGYDYSPSMAEKPYYPKGVSRPWRPPWWVIQRLGPDHFAAVTNVSFSLPAGLNDAGERAEWHRRVAKELRRLPGLERVSLSVDDGIDPAAQQEEIALLEMVTSLWVRGYSRRSGESASDHLAPLVKMSRLQSLEFNSWLDDADYRELAKIVSLRDIGVEAYSREQEALMKRLRPDVSLWAHNNYGD